MLQTVWVVLALVIFVAAWRSHRSNTAVTVGRYAVATMYIGAGAIVNAAFLARGDDYADFAERSYIPFVRDTWQSLVAPNHTFFISVLILFEATVGVLVALGGRRTQLGLVAAIAFHVALLSFGWVYYLWSLPMIAALARLLRAECRPHGSLSAVEGPTATDTDPFGTDHAGERGAPWRHGVEAGATEGR